MANCYNVILFNDFDWDFLTKEPHTFATNKEYFIDRFLAEMKKLNYSPQLLAQWSGAIVWDFDKAHIFDPAFLEVVGRFCDTAFYLIDTENFPRQLYPHKNRIELCKIRAVSFTPLTDRPCPSSTPVWHQNNQHSNYE